MPKIAKTDHEIENCFDVLSELRPHLVKSDFLETIREMEKQGYKIAFIEESGTVVAAAGYRISNNLFMGKNLYVDDLVTSEKQRSKGFGEILIQWLRQEAQKEKCNFFHLDSGTQRGGAHKFYFKQGFTIASYHFSENLNKS